jgi:hypothetical protein
MWTSIATPPTGSGSAGEEPVGERRESGIPAFTRRQRKRPGQAWFDKPEPSGQALPQSAARRNRRFVPLIATVLGLFFSFRMMRLPDPAPSRPAEAAPIG